ncbi:MAG: SGNH/GDSL hydrolase family protein [Acetatifactor sp.]|nr:SGNH/GDSL hydrolase family protein [Acetatifactor sp.]
MRQTRHVGSFLRETEKSGRIVCGRRRLAAAVLWLALCLTGCGGAAGGSEAGGDLSEGSLGAGGSEESTQSSQAGVSDVELTPPTSFLGEGDMELADMWPSCDDRALGAVMRKAEAGEPVSIVCIGGSITQGTISSGAKDSELLKSGEIPSKRAYADIFFRWWQERFPDTEFNFVNAGIGGTDSYLGVHRLEQDVLKHEPDLVLVEFSVNDGNDNFHKITYDNLIYNLLNDDSAPAVMLLFMAQTNGASSQGNHVLVGFHYSIPMVSYANVMSDMMETGRFSAKEMSGDEVHPSALGHAVTGEILWNYLNSVYEVRSDLGEPDTEAVSVLTKKAYGNARILDSDDIVPEELGDFTENQVCWEFPNGWSCDGEGGIVFTASFSRLGILYYATTDGTCGRFEVLVDGEHVQTINADFSGGWGNAIMTSEVYASGEEAVHRVEIRREADSTGNKFHLLGLMTSGSGAN